MRILKHDCPLFFREGQLFWRQMNITKEKDNSGGPFNTQFVFSLNIVFKKNEFLKIVLELSIIIYGFLENILKFGLVHLC